MAIWRLTTLGTPFLTHSQGKVPARFKYRRAWLLLAILAAEARPVSRTVLADRLWPGRDVHKSQQDLRPILFDVIAAFDGANRSPRSGNETYLGSVLQLNRDEVWLARIDGSLGRLQVEARGKVS